MPRKTPKTDPAVFSIEDFGFIEDDTDEREIEMPSGTILHVTLARLNGRQAKKIPISGALERSYKAAAPYVLDWDLRLKNTRTGEIQAVPAPGDPEATEKVGEGREWELLELLDNDTGSAIVMWLTNPSGMRLASERGKKSSTPSRNGATETASADTDTT